MIPLGYNKSLVKQMDEFSRFTLKLTPRHSLVFLTPSGTITSLATLSPKQHLEISRQVY